MSEVQIAQVNTVYPEVIRVFQVDDKLMGVTLDHHLVTLAKLVEAGKRAVPRRVSKGHGPRASAQEAAAIAVTRKRYTRRPVETSPQGGDSVGEGTLQA